VGAARQTRVPIRFLRAQLNRQQSSQWKGGGARNTYAIYLYRAVDMVALFNYPMVATVVPAATIASVVCFTQYIKQVEAR